MRWPKGWRGVALEMIYGNRRWFHRLPWYGLDVHNITSGEHWHGWLCHAGQPCRICGLTATDDAIARGRVPLPHIPCHIPPGATRCGLKCSALAPELIEGEAVEILPPLITRQ